MRAGRLRHRLVIDQPVTTQMPNGEEVISWVPFTTVWAGVEPIRGNEAMKGNQILAEMDTRIILRWSESIDQVTAKWRGRHGGLVYNFVSLAHRNMDRREVEIMAKSGLNEG